MADQSRRGVRGTEAHNIVLFNRSSHPRSCGAVTTLPTVCNQCPCSISTAYCTQTVSYARRLKTRGMDGFLKATTIRTKLFFPSECPVDAGVLAHGMVISFATAILNAKLQLKPLVVTPLVRAGVSCCAQADTTQRAMTMRISEGGVGGPSHMHDNMEMPWVSS